jgi:hypothetical protein
MPDPYQRNDLMDDIDAPQRVSALAVSSLVFGLLCCIPVVGLIAVILGATGLIKIRESEGRLGGKTLATVGIVLGLIGTIAWLAIAVGVKRGYAGFRQGLEQPTLTAMQAIENQDWPTARAFLDKRTSAALSDADLAAFRDAYHTQFGAFQGTATHVDFSLMFAPPPTGIPTHSGMLPVPAEFQQGPAMIMLVEDNPNALNDVILSGATTQGMVTNIAVTTGGQKHVWLIDPLKTPSRGQGPAGATGGTPAPSGATGLSGPTGAPGSSGH